MGLADILSKHQAQRKTAAVLPDPRPSAAAAFNFLVSNLAKTPMATFGTLNEGYNKDLSPTPCDSIDKIFDAVSKKVKLSQSAQDAFVVIMATAISLKVDGPFLWTHITGPSSSLKSTLLRLVTAAYDKVFSQTDFKGFFSGSTANGKDNSLLPQLQDKLFVIHDFTPIIQGKADDQNTICTQFRVIYEGEAGKFFNNGISLDYRNVRFSCLTGVTHTIYAFRRADMGERFSIFDLNSIWTSEGLCKKIEPELDAEGNAFDSIFSTMGGGFQEIGATKIDQLDPERCLCWGFFNHLMEHIEDESAGLRQLVQRFSQDAHLRSIINCLATWLESGRCNLAPKNDPYTIMTPAEPHRSIKILAKYAICIAIVLQDQEPTHRMKGILRKLAFDTGKSKGLEIMHYLAVHPRTTKKLLASAIKLSDTWTAVWCDHLISIGVLEEEWQPQASGPGRQSMCYQLTQRFRMIADAIGLKERHMTDSSGLSKVLAQHNRPKPFGRKIERTA